MAAEDTPLVAARRARLRSWIQERFDGSRKAFLADVAQRGGFLDPTEVSNLQTGKKSFGEKKAEQVELSAGMPPGYLVRPLAEAAEYVAAPAPVVSPPATPGDYVRVQQLDAEVGMGGEMVNDDYPEVIRAMDFTAAYIRSVVGFVPSPGRLVLVTGRGDSMIPIIQPGESLMVDTGVTSFDGDGIYLINTGNGQQVKGLQDRGDAIYVVSANTVLYPSFAMPRSTVIGGKVYLRNRIERFN